MRNVTAAFQRFLIAVAFLITAAAQSAAFTFTPMVTTIAPSGDKRVMTFKVVNDSSQQIAVAIRVFTRSMDELGVESNKPADTLFLVFPARIVLEPNSAQNLKLQYRGPSALSAEAAYRVVAEQLPVDFTKATSSGVNIMLRYMAALYVAPDKVTANISFISAVGTKQSDKNGLLVKIKNDGTRHAILLNTLLRITQSKGSSTVEISGDSMAEIEGQNVLAKSTRAFFIPWEPAVVGATYEGAFSAEIE